MEKERIEELIKFTAEQKKKQIINNIDKILEQVDDIVTYDEEENQLKLSFKINETICLEAMDQYERMTNEGSND